MPLYALDEGSFIHAADASVKKTYVCSECFGPVKRRSGKTPHFYHLKEAANCRLYSKSETHLTAQLELKKRFPDGVLQLEKSFSPIRRIADLCWEKEKIVFEIQTSQIAEQEAEARISDYSSMGYEVVWLLDDRIYNKRTLRPSEKLLRARSAYYLSTQPFFIYDQFESFLQRERVRRGRRLHVDLTRVFRRIDQGFLYLPKQLSILKGSCYFYGDRMSQVLRFPNEALKEKEIESRIRRPSRIFAWIQKKIKEPYLRFIDEVARKC